MSDLLKLLKRDIEPFEVKVVPINQCYQCTIDDGFEDVAQFAPLVDYLNSAVEGDVAYIKISTPGGALHAIIPLIEAMNNTEAHIAMHVESDTASAGTILMMLADEVYINPYTTIMIHTASYGFYGHSGNMESHVAHNTKGIEKLVNDIYKDFLTKDEIARVLDGREIYLTAEDCNMRFKYRQDVRAGNVPVQKKVRKPRTKRVNAVEAPAQQDVITNFVE